ncbi:MAG: LemA family protein [Limisphaerales bacterium]
MTETYTDSDGKQQTRTRTESGWTTVAEGGEGIPFYLQDECGVIRIQPAGAKLEPQTLLSETCGRSDPLYYGKGPDSAVPDSDHRRRFVEHAIPLHAPLFVVGQARERDDMVAPEIAADGRAPLFLISTRSEQQVSHGFRAGFWLLGLLGLVLAPGAFLARDATLHRDPALDQWWLVGVALVFLLAWLLGWVWMVYNSLIDLRQRVRQGWANVDVQLKRRADLIPNLVAIVTGLRDYERTVQTQVTGLRTQLQATPPGEPGPDPAGCLRTLNAVAEAYPELTANRSFLKLQQQLVETEQRIALARSYFNDITTFYNTRLQIVPDRFIARLSGLAPRSLLTATDFERAPVRVRLAA